MKVSEAVTALLQFPQDLELMDEYAEETITGFSRGYVSDEDGDREYVSYETAQAG